MDTLLRNGVISAVLVILCFMLTRKRIICGNTLGWILFTLFASAIFFLTGITPMSGLRIPDFGKDVNLIPLIGLIDMVKSGINVYTIKNLLGNILMFAPIGFLAPILCRKYQNLRKTLLLGAAFSLLLECTQLFLERGTDINDLILNTLGTAIGYCVYRMIRGFFPKLSMRFSNTTVCDSRRISWVCISISFFLSFLMGYYDLAVYHGYI